MANDRCPTMLDEYKYPSLIQGVPTNASTSLEARLQILKERCNLQFLVLEERTSFLTKMLLDSVEEDIVFTAGEVLKWAVKKQGVVEGQSFYYFDKNLLLSCTTFGAFGPNPGTEGLATFKVISQEITQARNNGVHFVGLDSLERKVRKCTNAISEWPHLNSRYPNQCRVILDYPQFKAMLPECFQ